MLVICRRALVCMASALALTRREASARGFGAAMVCDAAGTRGDEMQTVTLKGFSRLWGRVAATDDVIAELRAGAT